MTPCLRIKALNIAVHLTLTLELYILSQCREGGENLNSRYPNLVELLAYLVKEKVYGPVDRLARAADLETVYMAIYEALRYASTEVAKGAVKVPPEEEVRQFLDEVSKRGASLARRIAIEALTVGLRSR
jgi:hypothetical protein